MKSTDSCLIKIIFELLKDYKDLCIPILYILFKTLNSLDVYYTIGNYRK